eukprot:11167285-Lingulodinium_polyedra.AAC.1
MRCLPTIRPRRALGDKNVPLFACLQRPLPICCCCLAAINRGAPKDVTGVLLTVDGAAHLPCPYNQNCASLERP